MIGDGDAAHLGRVFGRNGDFQQSFQDAVAAADVGLVDREDGLVGVRWVAHGQMAGRPDCPRVHVADIDALADPIAGAVLAPAGDGQVAVGAAAAAGVGHEHSVGAVGDQECAWSRRVRRAGSAG